MTRPLPLHIAVIRPDLAAEGAALVELIRRMDADDAQFERCGRCGEVVEKGADLDGCRDPNCEQRGYDKWKID